MRMRIKGFLIRSVFSAGSVALALSMLAATAAAAGDEYSRQQELVDKARLTFEKFAADPMKGWRPSEAKNVKALFIVPQLLKGAFGLGAGGGSGVLLVRDEATGEWSQPAFYTLGALSFGLQVGGDASEMVLVVKKTGAVDSFYTSSFKLGGDANVAAGGAGVGIKGWTRLTFGGGMVGYLVSQGLFAGASAEGAVVAVSGRSNEAYYGQGIRPTDILVTRTAGNPGAEGLRAAVAGAMK